MRSALGQLLELTPNKRPKINFGAFSKFTFNMHTCKLVRATAMSTYASLSLRTLKNGLNHPSGLLPVRHPGHGVDQPLFDRYGTLRTFFKRHSTVESRTQILTREACNGVRRSASCFAGTVQLSRQFHSCGRKSYHARDNGNRDHAEPFHHPHNTSRKSEQQPNVTPEPDKPPSQTMRQVPPNVHKTPETPLDTAGAQPDKRAPNVEAVPEPPPPPPNYDNYPNYLRQLAMSLPHLHRPTRDDFLNIASGFWQRARIRFKWFTIKSFRKFNADDISAFVTWFLTAQFLWIFIGT